MSYEQFAYVYDRLMRDMPYAEWQQWIRDKLAEYDEPVRKIVDLGCGTGTISFALARDGYDVFGIDYSEHMLAVAEQKYQTLRAQSAAWSIEWIHQDMREWQLMHEVDVVLSLCDCLNYILEPSGVQAVFARTYEGLRLGGLFLFDVHTPEEIFVYAEHQPYFLNEEDVAYLWTNELDTEQLIIEHDLTIFVKDQQLTDRFSRIQETHIQRGYDLDWLADSLREVGFVDVQVSADFTTDEPHAYSQRAFFSCRKP